MTFVNPQLYQHALAIAIGPYPTVSLVPHALMNLREALDAAQCVYRKLAGREAKKRLQAFVSDCCDVQRECIS